MGNLGGPSAKVWVRRVTVFLLIFFVFSALVPAVQHVRASDADPNSAAGTRDQPGCFIQIIQNLFNSDELMRILQKTEFTILSCVALNLIVFVGSGLLIGFCLPGDSLL